MRTGQCRYMWGINEITLNTYTLFRHGKNISYKIKILKIKLILMFAVWEYEEDNRRSISFLKLVKDLMALTLDGMR